MKILKDYDGGLILQTRTHETVFGFDWKLKYWAFGREFAIREIYSVQIGAFYFVRRRWRKL